MFFDLTLVEKYGKYTQRTFKTGTFISKKLTTKQTEVFIIKEGLVSFCTDHLGTREVFRLGSGAYFGLLCAMSGCVAISSYVAVKDTEVYAMDCNDFIAMCKTDNDLLIGVIKDLVSISNIQAGNAATILGGILEYGNNKIVEEQKPLEEKKVEEKPPVQEVSKPKAKIDANSTIYDIQNVAHIFPVGLDKNNIEAPETYSQYLCDTEAVCPVCGKKGIHKSQLTASLPLLQTDYDLRRHYKGFEPLWFNVWMCENCYYANYHYDFNEIESFYQDQILAELKKIKANYKFDFEQPYTIDKVIASYYIALECAKVTQAKAANVAKMWLHLSWLYKDINDEQRFNYASIKALEWYEEMYYNTKIEYDGATEQTIFIIMAELNVIKGEIDKAMNLLFNAKKISEGNRLYSIRAGRRLDELREERANGREAAKK